MVSQLIVMIKLYTTSVAPKFKLLRYNAMAACCFEADMSQHKEIHCSYVYNILELSLNIV